MKGHTGLLSGAIVIVICARSYLAQPITPPDFRIHVFEIGGSITSDGGALLLRKVEWRLGLMCV